MNACINAASAWELKFTREPSRALGLKTDQSNRAAALLNCSTKPRGPHDQLRPKIPVNGHSQPGTVELLMCSLGPNPQITSNQLTGQYPRGLHVGRPEHIPEAKYVRMSTQHQQYSLTTQTAAIQECRTERLRAPQKYSDAAGTFSHLRSSEIRAHTPKCQPYRFLRWK